MKNRMKNSVFETPKDWKVKALGDVASINMGQSPSSSAYNEEGNGIPLIQGNADIKNRKTVPRTWTTEFPKVCQEGDIIMTVRAPVGAIAMSLQNACLGRGVCAITSKVVDNGYLYQYLLSYETKWAAIEQGSTFTAVNGNEIRKIEIVLPPLPEQRKIAEILSTLDEKMAVIDEQLAQTQELKRGLMQRLLTKGIGHTQFKDSPLGQIPESWDVKNVDEIATIKTGAKDTQNKEEFGKYPFFVRSQTIERISTYSFDGEAVLTAGDGVGVGKVYHYINGKFDYHQRVYNIHNFNTAIFGKFFFEFFKENFMLRVRKYNAKGSVDSVRREMISKMDVPLPPLPEQHQIAEIFTTVEDKVKILTDKKAQYHTLKKGLMQQLLTGQRRVRVAEQVPALV